MDWKDTIKGVAKAAKDTAEGVSGIFVAEVWPLLAPQLLLLAARLEQDVRSGAVEANAKVRAFLKEQATPTVVEVLRNDDAFDFLAELAYEALPRPAAARLAGPGGRTLPQVPRQAPGLPQGRPRRPAALPPQGPAVGPLKPGRAAATTWHGPAPLRQEKRARDLSYRLRRHGRPCRLSGPLG